MQMRKTNREKGYWSLLARKSQLSRDNQSGATWSSLEQNDHHELLRVELKKNWGWGGGVEEYFCCDLRSFVYCQFNWF